MAKEALLGCAEQPGAPQQVRIADVLLADAGDREEVGAVRMRLTSEYLADPFLRQLPH